MKSFLVLILLSMSAFAEEIEEAQGLGDEVAPLQAQARNENFRHRVYLLGEGISQKSGSAKVNDYSNFEASLSLNYDVGKFKYFIDGIADHRSDNVNTAYLNQIGLRYQAESNLNFAFGKERSRRSPGIIVSPSDFIFSQSSLPGQREDRRGVWLLRASYQIQKVSYDVFILPVSTQDEGGWPTKENKYLGTAVRSLQQYENLDVSVSAGTINSVMKAGLAFQGFLQKVWKLYYEVGYAGTYTTILGQETKQVSQHLLGLSYEGSEDYGFKFEYYYNGQGLDSDQFESFRAFAVGGTVPTQLSADNLFLRKHYGIISFSALEIKNRYNLITSVIKSFEDASSVGILRAEWLINDHAVLGTTGLFINGGQDGQYFVAPFNQQYSVDLKYTF